MPCLILLYPVLLGIATSGTERVNKEGCIEVKKKVRRMNMELKKLSYLRRMGSLTVFALLLASALALLPAALADGDFEIKPSMVHYDDTMDVEVFNATGGAILELYNADTPNQKLGSVYADGAGYGKFSSINFNMAGGWTVKDVDSNQELPLTVHPAVTLALTVSPDEITYTKGTPSVDISGVVTDDTGNPVEGAEVIVHWIDENGNNQEPGYSDVTDTNGGYSTAVFGLRGVGYYNITAETDLIGGPENELMGFTQLPMVVTSELVIEDVSTETVHAGFTGEQEFSIRYIDDNQTLDWSKPMNITLTHGDFSNYTGDVTMADLPGMIYIDEAEIAIDKSDDNLILSGRWPTVGSYEILVKQNYEGNSLIEDTVNHSYEYISSVSFDVLEPVPVSVDVLTPTLDVKSISTNLQEISITLIGESETEFGDETILTDNGNLSITDAIAVTGDILYPLNEQNYSYQGDGTWGIEVFPTIGGGEITLTVNWPDRSPVTESVSIVDGRVVTIDVTEVVVDSPVNVTALVSTSTGTKLTEAQIDLIYKGETEPFLMVIGDETENNGLDGRYQFEVNTTQPHNWVIVYVTEGSKYAYAKFWSGANNDLRAALSPSTVLAGAHTTFTMNVTQNGNNIDVDLYLLNETELDILHSDVSKLSEFMVITPATHPSMGNYTYDTSFMAAETYYLYAVTPDGRHDNLNSEPSFDVTLATITGSPSMLAKKVDDNTTVTFTVEWANEDVSGTLHIMGIDPFGNSTYAEGMMMEVPVVNGTAVVHNVNALNIGDITFEFKPEAEGSMYHEAAGDLPVVPPSISVTPSLAVMGTVNEITVTVTHPATGAPSPDLDVTAMVPGQTNEIPLGATDSSGQVSVGLVPSMTGPIQFFVEGDPVETIVPVTIGMEIIAPEEVSKDEKVTIKVRTAGGKKVVGANVYLDGVSIGTTDSDGKVLYKAEDEGVFEITATHSTYAQVGAYEIEVVEEAVPGFEAVAILVAFLGAVLFFYRRKK